MSMLEGERKAGEPLTSEGRHAPGDRVPRGYIPDDVRASASRTAGSWLGGASGPFYSFSPPTHLLPRLSEYSTKAVVPS